MSDSLTLTFGGQDYPVAQLTLRQCRTLGIGLMSGITSDGTPDQLFQRSVDKAVEGIALALSTADKVYTADMVLDLPMTAKEAITAYDAIIKHAGFVAAKPSGEAAPGAA